MPLGVLLGVPAPESVAAPHWPRRCLWCGLPTEPVEDMLRGRYRLQRPRYRFWCVYYAETDKKEN